MRIFFGYFVVFLSIFPEDSCGNEGVIELVDEIVNKNEYEKRITSVNFITASWAMDLHESELFTALIARISKEKAVTRLTEKSVSKLRNSRMLFNIIFVSSMKGFNVLLKHFTDEIFNFGGYFVIIFGDASLHDAREIFQMLWDFYIYNVNLIRLEKNETTLVETFFPFLPASCNRTNPAEVARHHSGKLVHRPVDFFPKKFSNFHNCHLKVATFKTLAPSVLTTDHPNGTMELYGRDIEIIKTLEKELNFRANVTYLTKYGSWGVLYPNGTTTGAMGMAQRRETDFAIGNLNLKYDRALIMDYSIGYYLESLIFVVPQGQPYSSFRKLQRPFDTTVWLSLLITIIVTVAVIIVLYFQKKRVRHFIYGRSVKYPLLNVIMAIFGVSYHKLPSRNFARFLLMTFLMFCLVIRSLYQGSLYQFMQITDSQPPVASIEEMAERDFTFYLIASYDDMTRSNAVIMKRRKIIPPSDLYVIMNATLDDDFRGSNLLAISEILYSNQVRARSKEVLYTVCKQLFTMIPVSIYYPKDSYLVAPFDDKLIWFQDAGLILHWISKEVDYKYLSYKPETTSPQVMNVEHLSGTFQIWMILCICSIVVFVGEIFWNAGHTKIRESSVIRLKRV